MLKLSIVTDPDSWYLPRAMSLATELRSRGHDVEVVHAPQDIPSGDVALLLSLGQLVRAEHLARNEHNVVVHASALPAGKGWSPVTWQIIAGARRIPFTLFEAVTRVDAGPIYMQSWMETDGTELIDELRTKQAETTNRLCVDFIDAYPDVLREAVPQRESGEYMYPRRGPEDSKLNPDRSIADQFDLMRTCDPQRYPAFFELRGRRYEVTLRKVDGTY